MNDLEIFLLVACIIILVGVIGFAIGAIMILEEIFSILPIKNKRRNKNGYE